MGKYSIDETTLTNTADAIRAKTGDENGIDPVNFPVHIGSVYEAGVERGSEHAVVATASGSTVSISDISPTEHEIGVRVSSKNLFNSDIALMHELSYASANDVIYHRKGWDLALSSGTYTFSVNVLDGEDVSGAYLYAVILDSNRKQKEVLFLVAAGTIDSPKVRTLADGDSVIMIDAIETHTIETAKSLFDKVQIQIEKGSTATAYTPCVSDLTKVVVKAQGENLILYPVNADGTVDGAKSAYPTLVVSTDTIGVNIECEYYQDPAKVVDSAKDEKWVEFWNDSYVYQHENYGNVINLFGGRMWNDNTFFPLTDLELHGNAQNAFYNNGVTDIVARLAECNVVLDTANVTAATSMFSLAITTTLPFIDLRNLNSSITSTFAHCQNLVSIDGLAVSSSPKFNNTFAGCGALVKLIMHGTIGNDGFDVSPCPKLSEESGLSIINALSTETTGLSVTLPSAWAERYNTAHGESGFDTLVATRSNWTILVL